MQSILLFLARQGHLLVPHILLAIDPIAKIPVTDVKVQKQNKTICAGLPSSNDALHTGGELQGLV